MFEIVVTGRFVARHQLRMPDGSLEPLHAHEWHVKVAFAGPALDSNGLLLDFAEPRRCLDRLLAELAGGNLNELPAWVRRNPSAELVAQHIAEHLRSSSRPAARLVWVEVEEEPGCFARYFPEA